MAMTWIWTGMVVLSLVFGLLTGRLDAVADAAMDGAASAVALCRELTKLHEETRRTTLGEAADYYRDHDPKGEYVLVVAGCPPRETAALTAEEAVEQVLRLVDQGARLKDAAREVAEHTGLSKNELYAAALDRR